MSRFFQAPQTQDIDYVVQPAPVGAGGGVGGGGDIFDQLQVLDQHSPILQERVQGYRQEMDELASQLQNNPNAYAQLQPKLRDLRRRVHDDIQRGDIGQMVTRRNEFDEFAKALSKEPADRQRFYLNRMYSQIGEDYTQPLSGTAIAPNWTMEDIEKRALKLVGEVPKEFVTDLAGQLSRGIITFGDAELRTEEAILGLLTNQFMNDPQFASWVGDMTEMTGQDYAAASADMLEGIARETASTEINAVRRNMPRPSASSGAGKQKEQRVLTDTLTSIAVGDFDRADELGVEWRPHAEQNLAGISVLKSDVVSAAAVDPLAFYDQDGEVKGRDASLASIWANQAEVSEEEISPVLGDLIMIPVGGETFNVPQANAIRFRNYSSTANLEPGKVYVEIYPNQKSFDNREEGRPIYVEFNALNAPYLIHSRDAVSRRVLKERIDENYDLRRGRFGVGAQGQGMPPSGAVSPNLDEANRQASESLWD